MPTPFQLSSEQHDDFEQGGVARLPGFYPKAEIDSMARALWTELGRRFGADPHRPGTWKTERPAQFQALHRSGAFAAMNSSKLAALADLFLGEGRWRADPHGGNPLVTFPTGVWEAPRKHWHLDLPASGLGGDLTALRLFTFLEPVRPRGGGTLYVAGSHRVAAALASEASPGKPMRSAELKAALAPAHPWFAELFGPGVEDREQRFMQRGAVVRGMPVKVAEMTGEPGDLIVMHPATLHAFAPNGLERPRLMLTTTVRT